MLKTLMFSLALALPLSLLAQLPERSVETKIEEVKLFLQGAEVLRRQQVELAAGKQQLILTGLSPKLYEKTVQLTGHPSIKILSITAKANFLKRQEDGKEVSRWRDSVKVCKSNIDLLLVEQAAYEQENQLLVANREFKGQDKTLTLEELNAAAQFFRNKQMDISRQLVRIKNALQEEHRRLFDYKLQLMELNAGQQPTSEVYLVLDVAQAGSYPIELRYIAGDAGWMAAYDLYAGRKEQEVDFRYRALAYNNTGEDWKDVLLRLSTADPLQSATQPNLDIWVLNTRNAPVLYEQKIQQNAYLPQQQNNDLNPYRGQRFNDTKRGKMKANNEVNINYYVDIDLEFIQQVMGSDFRQGMDYNTEAYRRYRRNQERFNAPATNVQNLDVPDVNAEFNIAGLQTLPSDNKPYALEVKNFSLKVDYSYYAVPSLDPNAFLIAKMTDWEGLDLISGQVSVFNQERYIGQSVLDIRNLTDTLMVSLGRDPEISIQRNMVKGSNKGGGGSSQRRFNVAYEIAIRNAKKRNIGIEIQDQIPLSEDKEVVVNLDERSGAEYDAPTGILTWRFNLQSNEAKVVKLGYSIRYPKEKRVNNLNRYRKMAAPAF